jgi:hypothetical protein
LTVCMLLSWQQRNGVFYVVHGKMLKARDKVKAWSVSLWSEDLVGVATVLSWEGATSQRGRERGSRGTATLEAVTRKRLVTLRTLVCV